jgi:Putative zinc-finger
MTGKHATGDDHRCIELVELLTGYLDALDAPTRRQFDEHLEGCAGCRYALGDARLAAA